MTNLEAIQSITNYPIPTEAIEKYCTARGLDSTLDFDITVAPSDEFRLVTADVYLWLYTSPDLTEQEVSFTQPERDVFLAMANKIYADLADPAFTGRGYGFVGESY